MMRNRITSLQIKHPGVKVYRKTQQPSLQPAHTVSGAIRPGAYRIHHQQQDLLQETG